MPAHEEIEEIKRLYASVAGTLREPSSLDSLRNMLQTVERMMETATKRHPELADATAGLQCFETSLRASLRTPESASLAACEMEFYTLLETQPRLKSIYMAVTETEFIDLVSSRLNALQGLAKTRPLGDAEAKEIKKLEELLAEAARNLKVYTSS
jgi:hypothetical protein